MTILGASLSISSYLQTLLVLLHLLEMLVQRGAKR